LARGARKAAAGVNTVAGEQTVAVANAGMGKDDAIEHKTISIFLRRNFIVVSLDVARGTGLG
jgi:hypothetical protein